jgi:hypothetical protein
MSANTLITSIVTGGTNSHTTTAEEANALATDFVTQGVVGAIALNTGSGGTGSFCVNADATPDMGVTVKSGQAYVTATPSSQDSQVLRVRASSDYTTYTINANSSGSTKYDWIYLKIDVTKANNPAADASDVTALFTSRSSSNTTDNGSPPTYGLLLAVVTVANGASSITNSNISDKRFNTSIGAQNGSLVVTQQTTGTDAIIQAAGQDANINLSLKTKGTGVVSVNGAQIGQQNLKNNYKFSVYLNTAQSISATTWTRIACDTKNFDTSSNVDLTTNKGRFTAPVAGFYQFQASAETSVSGTTYYYICLFVNGSRTSPAVGFANTAASSGSDNIVAVNQLFQLNANDYVEPMVYCNGAITLAHGQSSSAFSGFLVSET